MECCDQPNIASRTFEKANPSLLGCLEPTLPLSYCLASTQCSRLRTRSKIPIEQRHAHFAGSLKTRPPDAVLIRSFLDLSALFFSPALEEFTLVLMSTMLLVLCSCSTFPLYKYRCWSHCQSPQQTERNSPQIDFIFTFSPRSHFLSTSPPFPIAKKPAVSDFKTFVRLRHLSYVILDNAKRTASLHDGAKGLT